MKPLVSITALLKRRRRDGDRVTFEITDDWAQGRTTFGVLIAALAVAAMRDVTGDEWPLRALQASFIGWVGVIWSCRSTCCARAAMCVRCRRRCRRRARSRRYCSASSARHAHRRCAP